MIRVTRLLGIRDIPLFHLCQASQSERKKIKKMGGGILNRLIPRRTD